jgi:hypothetical protein
VCKLCRDTRRTNMVIIVHKQSVNSNCSKLVLQWWGQQGNVYKWVKKAKWGGRGWNILGAGGDKNVGGGCK